MKHAAGSSTNNINLMGYRVLDEEEAEVAPDPVRGELQVAGAPQPNVLEARPSTFTPPMVLIREAAKSYFFICPATKALPPPRA